MKVTIPKNSAIVSESGYWTVQGVNDQVIIQTISGNLNLQETIKQLERFQTSGEGNVPVPEPEVNNIAYYVENFIDLPTGLDGDVGLVDTLYGFEVDDKNIYVKNTNWNLTLGFFDQPSNFPVANVKDGSIAISHLPLPYGAFMRNEVDEKWERFGFMGMPVVFETDEISNFYTDLGPLSTPAVQIGDIVLVDPVGDEQRKSVFVWDGNEAKIRLFYTNDPQTLFHYHDPTLTENNAIVIVEDGVDIKNSEAYIFDNSGVGTFSKLGGLSVLTFGSLSADYATFADLPDDAPHGTVAININELGGSDSYRAVTGFYDRTLWAPSDAYGEDEGAGLVCVAYMDGTETGDADLIAQGFSIINEVEDGSVIYTGSGITLRCAGATDTDGVSQNSSAGFGTPDLSGSYDENTKVWTISQKEFLQNVGIGAGQYMSRVNDAVRQMRYGSAQGAQHDRLLTSFNVVNPTSNWMSTFILFPNNFHHTLHKRNLGGSQGMRWEASVNGNAYIAAPLTSFTSLTTEWAVASVTSANINSRAIINMRHHVVWVRP